MKIKEVSKITGLTIRTLHHYDKIGLLKPKTNNNGYRIYDESLVDKLFEIIFLKNIGLSLDYIKNIINNENYDKISALKNQRALLIQKRNQIDDLIKTIDNNLIGGNVMAKKYNNEILENKDKYQTETKRIWGNTNEYKEYKQKTKHYTKEKWNDSINMSTSILQEFSNIKNNRPESEIAQELVKRWQEHISNSYYTCSDEILLNLSVMYTEDIRFMKNIDKNGEGTAKFIRDAIEFYINNLQK